MEPSIISAIVGGVAGLITGAIGSLVAPWVSWGIEKKRRKQERRIELIKQWREILTKQDFSREDFLNHPLYGPLRELISEDIQKIIERPTNEIHVRMDSPINDYDQDILRQEIARIEKLWDLI
jgi:hypothetical protein